MSLLFEIPAKPRLVTLKVMTYRSNRIASRFMGLLKRDRVFKVRNEWDLTGYQAERVYVLEIKSDKALGDIVKILRNEINSYISDHFPENYFFDFEDETPLGFINSFEIYCELGKVLRVSHRIKEIRKDGTSKLRA